MLEEQATAVGAQFASMLVVGLLEGGWTVSSIRRLTLPAVGSLFDGIPLRVIEDSANVGDAGRAARLRPARHAGDRLKRLFFKDAVYELVAERNP